MKKKFSYLFLFLGVFDIFSQNIPSKGLPFIQNYLPDQYGNHGKIWDISSAKNGLIYMTSDNGLLEFDGHTWNRYRDNKGFTRSLLVENDSTIYVGADMDFGIWKKTNLENSTLPRFILSKKNLQKPTKSFGTLSKLVTK